MCHDGTCSDPRYPYCDVTGAIGGEPGRCLAVTCTPGEVAACDGDAALVCNASGESYDRDQCAAGCEPVAGCRPFCAAGQTLSCLNDELTRCNPAGTGTVTQTCALGCALEAARCLTFVPLNGLGAALADSANEPDVTLPLGTRIDTDSGAVQDASGTPILVKSVVVAQVGAPAIRVLEGKSFSIMGATVLGTNPIAFVAQGTIAVTGQIEARARGQTGGPGAQSSSSCNGRDVNEYFCTCDPTPCLRGGGGAGNYQQGGKGGGNGTGTVSGGGALSSYSPLAGGCTGGSRRDANGVNIIATGGGGGGAVHLASLTSIELSGAGLIHVGGGGGVSTTGGGSGGLVILEAPSVTISGSAAGIAANGGAGGGCGTTGPDANATTSPAPGASCANYFAGSGGTGSSVPGNGCVIGVDSCNAQCPVVYGGGGGSVGRALVATKPGGYVTTGNPILSVGVTTGTLSPR